MTDMILHTKDLAVGYDGRAVVKDLTFSLRPGGILTLIGPNGAGKSTILKTLARRLEPVAGTVLLDGKALAAMAENELARRLSIVTTERVRAELMSSREVVATGRYPYTGRLGILSEHDRAVVDEAMALTHVTELRDAPFEQISDGQRQRVMLARALCQAPEVLLLDEPTSFLDVRYKVEFLTTLKTLAREKRIAVVMSLHELDCAARVSDTVLCVRGGAVDRVGRPEEIFSGAYIENALRHGAGELRGLLRRHRRPELFPEPRLPLLSLPPGRGGEGLQLPVLLLPALRPGRELRRELLLYRLRRQELRELRLPAPAGKL